MVFHQGAGAEAPLEGAPPCAPPRRDGRFKDVEYGASREAKMQGTGAGYYGAMESNAAGGTEAAPPRRYRAALER